MVGVLRWLWRVLHLGILGVLRNLNLFNLLVEVGFARRARGIRGIGGENVRQRLRQRLAIVYD